MEIDKRERESLALSVDDVFSFLVAQSIIDEMDKIISYNKELSLQKSKVLNTERTGVRKLVKSFSGLNECMVQNNRINNIKVLFDDRYNFSVRKLN